MVFWRRMEQALNQLERVVLPPGGVNVGALYHRIAVL